MARKEGLAIGRVSKAFANDVLLALSCREAGCVLVTGNERDFQRIGRHVPFDYVKPCLADYCRERMPIVLSGPGRDSAAISNPASREIKQERRPT